MPSVSSQYLDKVKSFPEKYMVIIHEKLFEFAHKFEEKEMALINLFGELMTKLKVEDFSNKPLHYTYLHHYHIQKHSLKNIC